MKTLTLLLAAWAAALTSAFAGDSVTFDARTAQDGLWSDASTWERGRMPKAGDFVQVRSGHTVTYDVVSTEALRMLHIAGTLTFSHKKETALEVGLIKVEPGETTVEDGFDCHDEDPALPGGGVVRPALEIGAIDDPIPANVTATIRLRKFAGTDPENFPAMVVCGGRWDVHGAPLNRTWVKLGATAAKGAQSVTLQEPVTGWRVGDRVIVTAGRTADEGGTFRQGRPGSMRAHTEERFITGIEGSTVTLDHPLENVHPGEDPMRSEIANLSRNVVIESAEPDGARGHTVYRRGSSGGISYAEFRHLGKEGALGKYAIHFHLVHDTMRGSGVLGASIWDSHNRWVTIHGSDHLLIRDCVGYQSRGHGFFLEDAGEQWNILDRNLAVQAFAAKPLPKQFLGFDQNDGAGFWWANGRNAFTRNVACENDRYGYHFEFAAGKDPLAVRRLRSPKGDLAERDVRTIPFLRFEDNESHSEGLYSFNFGNETHGSIHGDREHPFIARNLKAWETHYAIRPGLQFFLLDGMRITNAVYGIYAPDYDSHVYRDVSLDNVNSEPINRGNDDTSIQYGDFTYDGLTLANCRVGRDPLIQLTCTSPQAGVAGYFRGLKIVNSKSTEGKVVDLGGGPRNDKLQNGVSYFFYDTPATGRMTQVVSVKFPDALKAAAYHEVPDWTGRDVRAAEVPAREFPQLLAPAEDLPPATLVTLARPEGAMLRVRGVTASNSVITAVLVNGASATILDQHAGVADWEITLPRGEAADLVAKATDRAGNAE